MKQPHIKKLSPYELISIYKPTQKLLKELLDIEYKKLEKIKQTEETLINSIDKRKETYKEKESMKWLLLALYVNIPREEVMKKIEEYKKLISIQKHFNNNKKDVQLNIEQAKSIPISNYMDFNRAHRALCLWHDDRDPSMYYDSKRNRVHCFSCSAGGDTIDVVQKLFNKEFIEAVKLILNR